MSCDLAIKNVDLMRGDDGTIPVVADLSALNVASWRLMARDASGAILVDLSGAGEPLLEIPVAAAETSGKPAGTYDYDLELTLADSTIQTVQRGQLSLIRDITNSDPADPVALTLAPGWPDDVSGENPLATTDDVTAAIDGAVGDEAVARASADSALQSAIDAQYSNASIDAMLEGYLPLAGGALSGPLSTQTPQSNAPYTTAVSPTGFATPIHVLRDEADAIVAELRAATGYLGLGLNAGRSNTTGFFNLFVGQEAGRSNTTGSSNSFVGREAGLLNTTGSSNTFVGQAAGRDNTTGDHNVFIGVNAGALEMGSHRLYIANTDTAAPLIYGEFNANFLSINSALRLHQLSSTSTRRDSVAFSGVLVDATDATRKGRGTIGAYDAAAWREAFRFETNGSAAMVSWFGATAVAKQSLPAAATDAATTQALANAIRTLIINYGLA